MNPSDSTIRWTARWAAGRMAEADSYFGMATFLLEDDYLGMTTFLPEMAVLPDLVEIRGKIVEIRAKIRGLIAKLESCTDVAELAEGLA